MRPPDLTMRDLVWSFMILNAREEVSRGEDDGLLLATADRSSERQEGVVSHGYLPSSRSYLDTAL